MGMSFDGNGMGAVCMHLQLLQFAVFMHLLPRVDAMCLHLVGRRTLIALVNDMQFLFALILVFFECIEFIFLLLEHPKLCAAILSTWVVVLGHVSLHITVQSLDHDELFGGS